MKITKSQFKKQIIPIGYVSMLIAFFGMLFGFVGLFASVMLSIDLDVPNKNITLFISWSTTGALFLSSILAMLYFIFINKRRKKYIMENYYDQYKTQGFIQRKYIFEECEVKEFIILLEEKSRNFSQDEYDEIWNIFYNFIVNNYGVDKLNLVMHRIQTEEVKHQGELKQIIIQFYKYVKEYYSQYGATKIFIIPNDRIPDYSMRRRNLNILYDQGKVIYFRR